MKLLVIIVLLALASPLVLAIDCSGVVNQEMCKEIRDSAIAEEEKEYLLADIISDKKHYPDHDLVRDWNLGVSTTTPPDGTSSVNRGYIRNAWMKVLSVMPSIKLGDKLFTSTEGEVLTAYNHQVRVPSYTSSGDCKTKRYLIQNTGTLRMYLDNNYQGQGHLTSFSTSLPDGIKTKIKAIYSVYVRVKIKHYRWRERCYGDNCVWRCEYHHTGYSSSRKSITEEIPVVINNPEPTANFDVIDRYYNTVKADFSFEDIVNIELLFDDAYFKQHNYVFSEEKSVGNTRQIVAKNVTNIEENNLAYTGSQIAVASTKGCKIKLYDFFDEEVINCELDYVDFDVSTSGEFYSSQDIISVSIDPPRDNYKVSYAGNTYTTDSEIDLTAEYPHSVISVEYGDKVIREYVHVKNTDPLAAGLAIGVFGTLNYALIGIIKKYWGMFV